MLTLIFNRKQIDLIQSDLERPVTFLCNIRETEKTELWLVKLK